MTHSAVEKSVGFCWLYAALSAAFLARSYRFQKIWLFSSAFSFRQGWIPLVSKRCCHEGFQTEVCVSSVFFWAFNCSWLTSILRLSRRSAARRMKGNAHKRLNFVIALHGTTVYLVGARGGELRCGNDNLMCFFHFKLHEHMLRNNLAPRNW